MYTNLNINQALEEIKSLKEQAIYINKYKGKVLPYLNSSDLTKFERKILKEILKFRNAPWIRIRNNRMAAQVGCCTRTVIRATNKFKKHGILNKWQDKNKYVPNTYILNPLVTTGSTSYNYWFNSYFKTDVEKEMYLLTKSYRTYDGRIKLCYGNVTHNIDYNYIDNYTVPIKDTNDINGYDNLLRNLKNKQKERSVKLSERVKRIKEGIAMLSDLQKKWLIDHGNTPRTKELINHPKIKPLLITPFMEELQKLLDLDPREMFRLVAYPDSVMEECLNFVKDAVAGKVFTMRPVMDRFGWLLSMADRICSRDKIKPDWKFYYDLCAVTNVQPFEYDEPKIPLMVKNNKPLPPTPPKAAPSSIPPKVKSLGQIETVVEHRLRLEKDIDNYAMMVNNPDKYQKDPILQKTWLCCINNLLTKAQRELEQFNEKHKIHSSL